MFWFVAILSIVLGAGALASTSDALAARALVLSGCHVPVLLGAWSLAGRLRGRRQRSDIEAVDLVLAGQCYFLAIIATGLMLGVAGFLTRPAALAASAGIGVGMMAAGRRRDLARVAQRKRRPAQSTALAVLIVVAGLAGWKSLSEPVYAYDVLTYHLFFPARWIQEAAISIVPTWFGDPAPAYAPSATEVYYTWLMLPLGEDLVARCGQWPFWILLLCAAHVLGRELRLRPVERSLACLTLALVPAIAAQAATAMVDIAFAAHLVCVAAFTLRTARTKQPLDATALTMSLGLLVGTKFISLAYGLAMAPLIVWASWRFLAGGRFPAFAAASSSRAVMRRNLLMIPAIVVSVWIGGYWYARNWLVTGNPVYPLRIQARSTMLFDGAYGREQMENSVFNVRRRSDDDLFSHTVWEAAHAPDAPLPSDFDTRRAPGYRDWYRGPAGLIVGLFVLGFVNAVRRRPIRLGVVLLYLSSAAAVAVFWYVLPFQQPRFLWGPAALAVVGAFGAARVHRLAIVPIFLVVGFLWTASFGAELRAWFAASAAGWIVAVLVVIGWAVVRRVPRLAGVVPVVLLILPFAAVLAAIRSGSDPRAQAMNRWTFLGEVWQWLDRNVHDATIAYVGNNVPYFLCGRRMENKVVYVPARSPVDGRYHDFASLPESRRLGVPNTSEPAFDRFVMEPAAWLENMRALGVEYIFVNSLFPNLLLNYRHDSEGFPIERLWLDKLCLTPVGTKPVAECRVFGGGSVRLYRVDFSRIHDWMLDLPHVVQDETDALDRLRQDGMRLDRAIRDYPHAASVIIPFDLRPLATAGTMAE